MTVVTNGIAVLGLGAIGPLAAKPVMEGKAVLFKKFAGIDVTEPRQLIEVIAALEPTFGGIKQAVNSESDDRFERYWREYRALTSRRGVTAQYARLEMRRRTTLIVAMLLRNGECDGMICGTVSSPQRHLEYVDRVVGSAPGASVYATMNALLLPGRQSES